MKKKTFNLIDKIGMTIDPLGRSLLLVFALFIGFFLDEKFNYELYKLLVSASAKSTRMQLSILLISLPVLYVLWQFRTKDARDQIEKTEETAKATIKSTEAARKAINADKLRQYIDMLFSNNLEARCFGLIRLAEMKRQGIFADEIDIATRRRLNLNKANLQGENLSGLNLEGASLEGADLSGANLTNATLRHAKMHKATLINIILVEANLQWATLTETILTNADLSDSKLQNAVLIGATYWEQAKFEGAKFHPYGTKFPEHFGDPETRGMVRGNEPLSRP